MEYGLQWIEENKSIIVEASDKIWDFAELGLHEFKSSAYLIEVLEGYGFDIHRNLAGMETAFSASWGSGEPVIGFLAEYDALPGLSQKVSVKKEEVVRGAPGHGCGHNAYGAAVLGGVLGLQAEMKRETIAGTIVFYGCPAEEIGIGKVKMASDNIFKDCDALLTWHPMSVNAVWCESTTANISMKVNFYGKSSHAAGSPEKGRSALDAVELMNVGSNYLREHISNKARIHYAITNGGDVPNIVPAKAQVHYMIRSPERKELEELFGRVLKVAKGASIMTETTYDVDLLSSCYNYMPNTVLEEVILSAMKKIGPPKWNEEDFKFAREISRHIDENDVKDEANEFDIDMNKIKNGLHEDIVKGFIGRGSSMSGSTDVGDVSWNAPTAQFYYATSVVGTPGHSWIKTACNGSSLAHKGAVSAAKVLALSGKKLLNNPEILIKAKVEFIRNKNGHEYRSLLTEYKEQNLNEK